MHAAQSHKSHDEPQNCGRRKAARLRLAIPARLITLYSTQRCILRDLSCTGAQVALQAPLTVGEAAFLQCGGIEMFGFVVRCEKAINGFEFEHPLTLDEVLAVRHYSENFEAHERRQLLGEVRDWVTGGR